MSELLENQIQLYFQRSRRKISDHSNSEECWHMIRTWIENCQRDHEHCKFQPTPALPKRVVYVGCERSGQSIRLCDGGGKRAEYIALSHCWGQESMSRTFRSTIQDNMRSIDWEQLSPNFQDAIIVARRLHIAYVWIDALCIIVCSVSSIFNGED